MVNLFLLIWIILFVIYAFKSQYILDFVEKWSKQNQENSLMGKLIISFLSYASLQLLNSIIIALFIAMILIFSWLSIFEYWGVWQTPCASLLEIADVLGHKQIQMTKRYTHLCVSHKQKLIEKYFGEIWVRLSGWTLLI